MRYAILNDMKLEEYIGGGALVNENIQNELRKKDQVCEILTCKDGKTVPDDVYDYDFYIMVNIGAFPYDVLNKIIDTKPFITFRGDIPMVLYTKPASLKYEAFYNTWQNMFNKARATIFISPMQHKVFSQFFTVKNPIVTPPPLDIKKFKDLGNADRHGALYVGDICMARGCVEALAFMKNMWPNERYMFVGKILDQKLAEFLESEGAIVKDAIPHQNMPQLMNEYTNLVYYPNIYDSFCLKILEAELCGMKIHSDPYCVGRFSYNNIELEDLVKDVNYKSMKKIFNYLA